MGGRKFIVVAGDVMIDRNWLVAKPPAGTSQEHADVPAWKTLDTSRRPDVLGGAGIIARAAYSTSDTQRVCLIGAWRKDFNPAEAFPEKVLFSGRKLEQEGTPIRFVRFANTDFNTEKYRIYELSKGNTKLRWRYDWDLTKRESPYRVNEDKQSSQPPNIDEVSAVIVGDFDKGFLDTPGVQDQLAKYADRPFLLRSKRNYGKDPDPEKDLFDKLPWTVLLPNREDLARWVKTKTPSEAYVQKSGSAYSLHPELITSLQKLIARFQRKKERTWTILVKLDQEGAVLLNNDGKIIVYYLPETSRRRLAGIGAGDILMANLAVKLAGTKPEEGGDPYRSSIEAASTYCQTAEDIRKIEGWYATKTVIDSAELNKVTVHRENIGTIGELSEKRERSRNIGESLKEGKCVAEVCLQDAKWYLEDFLTVNTDMGRDIARLRSEITQYINNSDEKKPFVTALCGKPGSGKSTLAKALGKALKCEFVESNAAQWTSVEDMFRVCERIRTAGISNNLPMAFIDEVDSELGQTHWYARLLAPAWDGEYSLGGEVRKLGRVVFLLAGSDPNWASVERLMIRAQVPAQQAGSGPTGGE